MKFTKSQLKQVILETLEEAEHEYASDPTDYRDQIAGKIADVIEDVTKVDRGLAQQAANAIMLKEPMSKIIMKHVYGFALEEEKEDLSNE